MCMICLLLLKIQYFLQQIYQRRITRMNTKNKYKEYITACVRYTKTEKLF